MMEYGPIINSTTKRFSSRDSLGIEGVAASISAELCPIVTTVTPRAFYWPFLCWIYYDYHKYSGIKEKKISNFDEGFLKRQDYFFVLASLLCKNDERNLVGKQKTLIDIEENKSGYFSYNKDYFVTGFGGMQYYNAGCQTMSFIAVDNEETGERYTFPKLTQYGEAMALAFEKVIKPTRYYKEYRLRNVPVPRDVLKEYGRYINLGMNGFDECKRILRTHLFEYNTRLRECAQLAKLMHYITGTYSINVNQARYLLFDHFAARGEGNKYPDEIKNTVAGWEIVVGRQYFTAGIEIIWKYMLDCLDEPRTLEIWINEVLKRSSFSFSLTKPVKDIIKSSNYSFEEREDMIRSGRPRSTSKRVVENGLRVALSIYNRFVNRDDLENTELLLDYGRGNLPGTGSVSLNEWNAVVSKYREKPVRELLEYIMRELIVEQHKRTCFEKMTRYSQSINGFYFEMVDDLYIKNEHEYQQDFQGIRLVQLMQVMQDLDMFDGDYEL